MFVRLEIKQEEIMKEIEIYKGKDNETHLEVKFEEETVWLTQAQMATLFGKGRTTITEHIQNIFNEEELIESMVCQDSRHTTKHVAIKGKRQMSQVKYYNLDVFISVGYRVKSKQGTQFRQWATQRLKDYLVKGYSINEKRLKETEEKFLELKKAVSLLGSVVKTKELSNNEAQGLLRVLSDYTFALDILDQYDASKNIHRQIN